MKLAISRKGKGEIHVPSPRIRRSAATLAAVVAVVAALGVGGASAAGRFRESSACNWPPTLQPFMPWADLGQYFQAPGGNFEGSMSGWQLTGNASVVSGNEPWYVGNSMDSHSLALPDTTSAMTTPTMCVTALSPDFRMFIKNNGLNGYTDGQLAIYLNFAGADGKPQQVKIAGLKGFKTNWVVTPPISFIQYISTPLKSGYANISFTIKPNDNHGNWQLDDLYVDPIKSQ
jgi:hypothetical protein